MKQLAYTYLALLGLLLNLSPVQAQKWENLIGLYNRNELEGKIIEHYDHGYLIAGNTGNGTGNFQGWLVKTDINGQLLWDKQIISYSPDQVTLRKSLYDQDGNMYVFGWLHQDEPHEFPFVAKLDACGELQWCRLLAIEGYDFGDIEDAIFLDNGDLLALAYMPDNAYEEWILMFRISPDGECLWYKNYASHEDHPYFATRLGYRLNKFGDLYIITGYVYSPYPGGDPDHVYFRPMFIGIDEDFEEQWVVEFGIQDSLLGKAQSAIAINDTLFMGAGRHAFPGSGGIDQQSWLMFFNHKGEQVGYKLFDDEEFGPEILGSVLYQVEHIEGDKYLLAGQFEYDEEGKTGMGEIVVDTAGNVYNYSIHENTRGGGYYETKTSDDQYVLNCSYRLPNQNYSDIYIRKVNKDLESVPIDTSQHVYDSLCRHTIESGIVDLAGCDVITAIHEIPTLEQYMQKMQGIPLHASPNPTNTGEILLEMENTGLFPNLELQVFDVFGHQIHTESILPQQGAVRLDVSNWQAGLYVALIYSNGKIAGKTKVVVQ